MRFPMPNHPCDFEIPDDWLAEAGMAGFVPTEAAYCSVAAEALVDLTDIEPPYRVPMEAKDWRGFDRKRMVDVFTAIASGAPLPPVLLLILPALPDISRPPFKYRILDGMHRFYASVAAGFGLMPVTTRECFQ